jgi:cholesterol transport system auxiliary component
MRRAWRLAGVVLSSALALSCSTPDHPAARYDFGPARPGLASDGARTAAGADAGADAGANAGAGLAAVFAQVVAPPWLDSPAIVYRLAYDDAERVQSYAQSQWAATPAGLLQQRLRTQLGLAAVPTAYGGNAQGGVLRVDLDEFDQIFDSPQASRVRLRAQVSLFDMAHGVVRARRSFLIEQAAPSADALGAVHGLRAAVDEFAGELQAWLGPALVRPAAPATTAPVAAP